MSHLVKSWWKYNPILQKPMSLDPIRPWAWYWYYGPDPASGTSYGQYHDEDLDFDMLSEAAKVVYSPATGKPMKYVCPISNDEIKEHFSKVTADAGVSTITCSGCKANLMSDFKVVDIEDIHCSKCGQKVNSTEDAKSIKGKTMTTKVSSEKRVQTLKRRIRANVLRKKRVESARKRRTEIEEENRLKRRKAILAARANSSKVKATNKRFVKAEDEKVEDDELISLDTIMEAMEEEENNEIVEDEMYLDEESSVEMPEEMPGSELDLSEGAEPKEDEDEYYDLDMVLSMINRKTRLAKRRAKADGEKPAEEGEKPAEEKPVEEGEKPEEKPAEEGAEKPVEECAEEVKPLVSENPLPTESKEDMAAMKFEPLASLKTLSSVRKEDVDMTLYGEEGQDPTWNITIAGIPTARIRLSKQISPDEIRNVFCSEDYAKDLIVHCEKTGFVQTMNKVNAEFWSNHTSNEKISARYKAEANASFTQERKKLLATFKQDFRNCINIVSAGMSKNFYPDLGNALKEHMFTNLRTVGLPEQTAISVVEKSFTEGSAPYFDSLFEKAEEYMSLTPDSRKEIAAAISHGSSIEQTVELGHVAPATLGERVAQASVVASSLSTGNGLRVNKEVVLDTSSYKSQLRSVWRP